MNKNINLQKNQSNQQLQIQMIKDDVEISEYSKEDVKKSLLFAIKELQTRRLSEYINLKTIEKVIIETRGTDNQVNALQIKMDIENSIKAILEKISFLKNVLKDIQKDIESGKYKI